MLRKSIFNNVDRLDFFSTSHRQKNEFAKIAVAAINFNS